MNITMQGDVDAPPAPPPQLIHDDVVDRHLSNSRPKSSLMKKLSFLLHPKKSKSKSGSPSQKPAAPPPLPPAPAAAGSELELLFAQAEATLGELLVRAGASFEARSSSYSHADPHHHPDRGSDRSCTGELDNISALITSSSGSRSAKFSAQGHARRRSLSRVWQQLGGSLFCGSGHMSAYVMDHDMMAPAPSKGLYEDVVMDEAYWQSLADAMLLQQRHQQQQQAEKPAANDTHDQLHELSCGATKKVQNDQQQSARVNHEGEHLHVAEEEEDRESEIVPSIMDADGLSELWPPTCGSATERSSSHDMDSIYYRDLIGVQSRAGGCTRLNTTLDDSPNLAHNYLNYMKVGGSSSGLNRYSDCPEANESRRDSDQVQEQAAMVCGSSSMQPLEDFLWQARSAAGPSNLVGGSASSPSSRSAPESQTCAQEAAGVELAGTTSCRVSLMTLLHEEAAAGDSTATLEGRPEEEEAETAALLEEEGRRARSMRNAMQVAGEDPLLCCVCMIRRKGAALIPCGHTFCRTCAKQLFAGRGACPLCNNLIVQVLDIF